jgi:polyhydroxyalkanoate synthesis regulator phasin
MAFEITSLKFKDTTDLVLLHPIDQSELIDDKGKKVIITVYGKSSKEFRNAASALSNRTLNRGKQGEEQARAALINFLTKCTASVSNLTINDNEVKTESDIREMYEDESLSWIRDQVNAAITDESNFL